MSNQNQNGSDKPALNDLIHKHFADRARVLCLEHGGIVQTTRWSSSMNTKPSTSDVVAVLEQNPESGHWRVIFAVFIQNYTDLPELLDSDIALLKLGGHFQDILNNRVQIHINQECLRVQQSHKRTS